MSTSKPSTPKPAPGLDPTDRFELNDPDQLEAAIKEAADKGDKRDIKVVTTGTGSSFVVHY
jgi:hypothetical protein